MHENAVIASALDILPTRRTLRARITALPYAMSISETEQIRRTMSILGKRNTGVKKHLSDEERAARSARMRAQIDAGKMKRGPAKRGGEKDHAEAAKCFRKAAEQGDALAQNNLGVCYHKGEGVEKDYAEAYAWYNLSSTTHEKAGKARDALEKTMSPQQVADAQKRTKELRATVEVNAKAAK